MSIRRSPIRSSVAAAFAGAMLLAAAPALAADEDNTKQPGSAIQLPTPPAGKGQVVFFRKGGLSGSAVACSVFEKGVKVSSLGGGRYFVLATEPGRHEFTVKTEAKDVLALEVESGDTQFAQCRIKMGVMVGRPDIAPATEADFRGMKSLRLVDADDMGAGAMHADEMKANTAPAAAPAN